MSDPSVGSTTVIGLGSPLMADDGLGLVALGVLREHWAFDPPVEFVDGGTWGMNLLPLIESAGRLLLMDAIDIGAEPGRCIVLERDQLPKFLSTKISPHQVDLQDVLSLAEFRGTLPKDTVAIGLQPARVELSADLSPHIQRRIPVLIARVLERLEAWGHSAQERATTQHA
ncbi:MAG: HyaD/HybD family hydrogenase maturation endopeptidase [Gemmatimonadales bacterium]|nr:HyaD/HybD family hydrogenase maturation endopeptidase [Gemmatimonadales bacterium]